MADSDRLLESRLLVIDDDEYIIRLLGIYLDMHGFKNVRFVDDSRKALETYLSFAPDLIILDLFMPHIDGFDFLEMLKSLDSRLPDILILTSINDPRIRIRAMNSGAKGFLLKPFSSKEAVLKIKDILRNRKRIELLEKSNKELESLAKSLENI